MPPRYWIKGPVWDTCVFALPWLPLAVLLFTGLEDANVLDTSSQPVLTALLAGVLAVDMGHRLYTFPVAYADRTVFRAHRVRLLIAPIVVAAVFVPLRALGATWHVTAVLVLWNVWHVVMQRIGLLRIYGGKLGGAWKDAASARLDRALVWALLALTTVLVLTGEGARSTGDGQMLAELAAPLLGTHDGLVIGLAAATACSAGVFWLAHELRQRASLRERLPRAVFAASTAGLLLVPIASPLIGVLCLKLSHAVEYVAFVHFYEAAKHRNAGDGSGTFARLVSRPLAAVPLFFVAFCVLIPKLDLPAVVLGLVAPLHFLYDGWIWKVRREEVRAPLVAV